MTRLGVGWGATALILLATAAGARGAETPPGCAPADQAGGEWRTYGADLANTRNQTHEQVVSAADVPLLTTAWVFSSVANGGAGDFTGTPIIADGCMYVASTRGWIFAVNADTGKLVWRTKLPYGGGVNGAVAVADRTLPAAAVQAARRHHANRHRARRHHARHRRTRSRRRATTRAAAATAGTIYVAATRTQKAEGCPPGDPCQGPYVVALDQDTGHVVWATAPIDTQPGADVYGSPIVYDGVLMIGVSGGAAELGDEADRYPFEGSMSFLDASTGAVIKKTWTIHPPKQPPDDLAGGGIWSTPAVDTERKLAFVGAGNPYDAPAEHPHTDAVLEFDVDRASPRFGEIIGSYKGNVDVYVKPFQDLPCVNPAGNPAPYYPQGVGSCGYIDMDFGASPNLFKNSAGRTLVGAGQKSGVYHVFDEKTLKPVWTQITGPPTQFGGIVGSTAVDGQAIYGPDTIPGYVWSLSTTGSMRWIGPISDGLHWGPPVALANGVLYSVDFGGFLDAFDTRTGALLAKRPLGLGGGGLVSPSWGGVAVARHTIYAGVGVLGLADGFVTALRPGTVSDLVDDVGSTGLGNGGGGGGSPMVAGPSVVAGPGAASTGYVTPAVFAPAGGKLSFTNLDVVQHDVTSTEKGPDGRPLFHSKLVGLGEAADVEGVSALSAGSYDFFCSVHPGMRGTLLVR